MKALVILAAQSLKRLERLLVPVAHLTTSTPKLDNPKQQHFDVSP